MRDTNAVADETDSEARETTTEGEDSVLDETADDEAEVDSPAPVERRWRSLPPSHHTAG